MKYWKFLWALIPLTILWVIFYVGSELNVGSSPIHWYDFPYMLSCMVIFWITTMLAIIKIIDHK